MFQSFMFYKHRSKRIPAFPLTWLRFRAKLHCMLWPMISYRNHSCTWTGYNKGFFSDLKESTSTSDLHAENNVSVTMFTYTNKRHNTYIFTSTVQFLYSLHHSKDAGHVTFYFISASATVLKGLKFATNETMMLEELQIQIIWLHEIIVT